MTGFSLSVMVGSYLDDRPRMEEIVFCLEKNLENPFIGDVHIFIEDEVETYSKFLEAASFPALQKLKDLQKHSKVKVVPFGKRPLYQDYFEYANATFPEGRVVMISNSDIVYNQTLQLLADRDLSDVFICMSRNGGVHCNISMSQDTWIWRSPLKIFRSDWTLGLPGGDNRIAFEGKAGGYQVVNPCLSITNQHHHESRVRHWTIADRPKCAGQYLGVAGSKIDALKKLDSQ